MRLVLSFAALFLSIIFVQLGSGTLAPLDALSGLQENFTRVEIGFLGSAHFAGFFVGCWLAPRMMGAVGHVRSFAAFAVSGAVGALAHPLLVDPLVWAVLRVMTGFAVAGAYTVVEAWLQARLTNETRGQVMGVYRVVDLIASLAAQLMIAVLPPASYISYNIVAILCCLCVVPIALTRAEEPPMPEAPRLQPLRSFRLSPLGAVGCIIAGVTMPAFRMVGPIYGAEMGLGQGAIALFLASAVIGGAVVQIPAGLAADRFDRRLVLILISAAAVVICGVIALAPVSGNMAYVAAFAFGLATFPVFSLSSAHANDFCPPEFVTELNASLMFLYGIGAIAAPLVVSSLIDSFGPEALFAFIAVAHGVLIGFGLWRMTRRPARVVRTAYQTTPRTSYLIHRLLGRRG